MELLYNFTLIIFLTIFYTEAQLGPSKKLELYFLSSYENQRT